MRKLFLAGLALLATCTAMAQWKPVEGRIMTSWAEEINPENVLAEYPRPQMVRSEWQNLNGMWEYAIAPRGEKPEAWDGEILVPFAVESSLSGVGKRVGKGKTASIYYAPVNMAILSAYRANPSQYELLATMSFYPGKGSNIAVSYGLAAGEGNARSSIAGRF